MSDNKNNQGMAENSGSSFDNNPFNNTFTDNNSSFGSDNNTSSGFNESSDFTSSSSFGSSFEVSESNFGSDAGFGSSSDFGSDSGVGSNSDFGSDTEFGSNSDFSSEAGFGSNSDFGSDAGFGSSLDSDSDSGFGSNSDFGSDTGFGNSSDSGSDVGFGSNSDFGSDNGVGSSADFDSDSGFGSSANFDSDTGFGSSSDFGSDVGFGIGTDLGNNSINNNTTKEASRKSSQTSYKKDKKDKREVKSLAPPEYKQRIRELNNNATNKHYVLFFGKPASGKTFIIGSIINYLKSRALGQLIYRDELTTIIEDQMYYKMLDFYQGNTTENDGIGSSDVKQFYEFPFTFIPNNKKCQPMELVFVDCSGEHTQNSMYQKDKSESGALPNYLTAILESDVNVKICFVYDYYADTKHKGSGTESQTNILISAYNEAIHYQRPGEREFSKLMIMSKADMYRNVVDKYDGSAEKFSLSEVPAFANTFRNEIFETDNSNNFTFYSVGEFYSDSSLKEAKLNFKAPEKIIDWLYRGATGISFVKKEESLLSKIKKMLGF